MPDTALRDTVLVIDDVPETLNLLIDVLEQNGLTALVAKSAKRALDLLDRVAPDIILMDAIMPDIDGFEACRLIKSQAAFKHTPVIFMTGLTETEHVVRAFEVGGVDYVTKPVSPPEVVARIRTHLHNSRTAQSARIALDVSGRTLTVINAKGDILWSTPQASELIKSFIDNPIASGETDANADETYAWLQPQLLDIVKEQTREVTILTTSQGRLKASFLGHVAPGEYLLSLRDGDGPQDDEILCQLLDLTPREGEVLMWAAQGKQNRDIADILECSHRTINKHLEQIFAKMGVENRTAAATAAVRLLLER
jgi:DNA-binding NarL/FixJ family response regulator